jgi:hypothetical protein
MTFDRTFDGMSDHAQLALGARLNDGKILEN